MKADRVMEAKAGQAEDRGLYIVTALNHWAPMMGA